MLAFRESLNWRTMQSSIASHVKGRGMGGTASGALPPVERADQAGCVEQPTTTRMLPSLSVCTTSQVLGQRVIVVGAAGLS